MSAKELIDAAWKVQRAELLTIGIAVTYEVEQAFRIGYCIGRQSGVDEALQKTLPLLFPDQPGIDCPFNPETDRCQPQHQ